jgi:PTH1 family peptidyl-tRNA hydrolase
MNLVIGLGNPGSRYLRHRHNAGFLVIDRLAERWGVSVNKNGHQALVGSGHYGNHGVVLAKPQSFMNRSGHSVSSLSSFYKSGPEKVIVIHDDMDIAFGEVRLKSGGGHGGHNGLRDIQGQLGNSDFVRVRIGVSRPPQGWEPANYVLSNWTETEVGVLDSVLDHGANAVESIVQFGITVSMNEFNRRVSEEKPRVGTRQDSTKMPSQTETFGGISPMAYSTI